MAANAGRRIEERRYDDEVARLYRTLEALAQWRLANAHSIASTARVPLEAVGQKTTFGLGRITVHVQDLPQTAIIVRRRSVGSRFIPEPCGAPRIHGELLRLRIDIGETNLLRLSGVIRKNKVCR